MSFLRGFWEELLKRHETVQKNVEQGSKAYGSKGADFKKLTGAKDLNARQQTIFDEKLKQAIGNDPRAATGALTKGDLKALAQQAADVATNLAKTPLDDVVDNLAAKSPTLKDNLVRLQNDGWTIVVGTPGAGSSASKATKTITIDPRTDQAANAKAIVISLAHETGHADYTPPADPPVADPSPTIDKGRDYIRKRVENDLLDEGQAQIIGCKTARELEAAGETGIGISGGHDAEYLAIYDKIVAGTLTMDQGRTEMAKIMAKEETSTTNPVTGAHDNYIDYYSTDPRDDWNKAHPEAVVPATPRVTVFP